MTMRYTKLHKSCIACHTLRICTVNGTMKYAIVLGKGWQQ